MSRYPIATESMDLELYQLAVLIAASKNLASRSKEQKIFRHLQDTFELSEVSKKLISVAVALRSFIDNTPDTVNEIVGKLISDKSKDETIHLDLMAVLFLGAQP